MNNLMDKVLDIAFVMAVALAMRGDALADQNVPVTPVCTQKWGSREYSLEKLISFWKLTLEGNRNQKLERTVEEVTNAVRACRVDFPFTRSVNDELKKAMIPEAIIGMIKLVAPLLEEVVERYLTVGDAMMTRGEFDKAKDAYEMTLHWSPEDKRGIEGRNKAIETLAKQSLTAQVQQLEAEGDEGVRKKDEATARKKYEAALQLMPGLDRIQKKIANLTTARQADEASDYEAVKRSTRITDWRVFLAKYRQGPHAGAAQMRLNQLLFQQSERGFGNAEVTRYNSKERVGQQRKLEWSLRGCLREGEKVVCRFQVKTDFFWPPSPVDKDDEKVFYGNTWKIAAKVTGGKAGDVSLSRAYLAGPDGNEAQTVRIKMYGNFWYAFEFPGNHFPVAGGTLEAWCEGSDWKWTLNIPSVMVQ